MDSRECTCSLTGDVTATTHDVQAAVKRGKLEWDSSCLQHHSSVIRNARLSGEDQPSVLHRVVDRQLCVVEMDVERMATLIVCYAVS